MCFQLPLLLMPVNSLQPQVSIKDSMKFGPMGKLLNAYIPMQQLLVLFFRFLEAKLN